MNSCFVGKLPDGERSGSRAWWRAELQGDSCQRAHAGKSNQQNRRIEQLTQADLLRRPVVVVRPETGRNRRGEIRGGVGRRCKGSRPTRGLAGGYWCASFPRGANRKVRHVIGLQAARTNQKAKNSGGGPMVMGGVLRMMPGIVVRTIRVTAFVAQHEMEMRMIHSHAHCVRSLQRRPQRQQSRKDLTWPEHNRDETKHRSHPRAEGSTQEASVVSHVEGQRGTFGRGWQCAFLRISACSGAA